MTISLAKWAKTTELNVGNIPLWPLRFAIALEMVTSLAALLAKQLSMFSWMLLLFLNFGKYDNFTWSHENFLQICLVVVLHSVCQRYWIIRRPVSYLGLLVCPQGRVMLTNDLLQRHILHQATPAVLLVRYHIISSTMYAQNASFTINDYGAKHIEI